MISICIFIFLLFVIFLIMKPHYAILTYVPCSVLFQTYICLRFAPPALTLHFVLDFIVVSSFIIKRNVKYSKFPFFYAFCLLCLLMLIGIIVSPLNISQVAFYVVGKLISYFVVVIFFYEIRQKQDYKYAVLVLGITFVILFLYALGEFIFQNNFLHEYVYLTINPEYLNGKLYLTHEIRYSSIRCSSLFPISISWGGFCCLMMSFFSYFIFVSKYRV